MSCTRISLYPITLHRQKRHNSRKASLYISPVFKLKGSVTVEAALAVPFFFLAVLSLFYIIEVMSIRTAIRSGMQYAGKKYAQEAYLKPTVSINSLERDIVQAVGTDRLNRSIVEGGAGGICCDTSRISSVSAILDLKVTYKVQLPIPAFHFATADMQERMRIKGWNGYVKSGITAEDSTTVYITETGMVYHLDYHCNYLELSIRMVPVQNVGELRNESKGKYYPCEHCMGGNTPNGVYITDYGDRYHSSLGCSGLKRTVYAVPLSEAVGKGACSKCGK